MNRVLRNILIVLIVLWTLIPFYSLIVTSITSTGSIGSLLPKQVTFRLYYEVFTGTVGEQGILRYLKDSLIVCSLATMVVVLLALPCAYSFSRWRSRASTNIYFGYFILRMLPPISLLIPWYLILNSLHLVDTYAGLALVYVVFQLPVGIWLMKGFFDTIPQELEESAWVEGATIFQTLRKVVIPLVSNGLSVTFVFVFIYCYIEFMYASVFSRTMVITLPVYVAGFSNPWESRFNLMLTAALISMIPMIILFLLVQRYIVKGITGGALK